VEYADRILPLEDEEISKEMTRLLKKRKVNIVTGAKVLPETLEKADGRVSIQAETASGVQTFAAEKLLVSVGRQANVENIGLEATEIKVERGVIVVNEHFQTAEPHIYAIGDVIGGLQPWSTWLVSIRSRWITAKCQSAHTVGLRWPMSA